MNYHSNRYLALKKDPKAPESASTRGPPGYHAAKKVRYACPTMRKVLVQLISHLRTRANASYAMHCAYECDVCLGKGIR
jgi:hypothetical protein